MPFVSAGGQAGSASPSAASAVSRVRVNRRDPKSARLWAKAQWVMKLEAAELLRPDLVDGTTAYRHFLFGGGAARSFNYERFIAGDSSGAKVLASALEDARKAVIDRHDVLSRGHDGTAGVERFHVRSEPIPVGNDGRYPYPATENWQKAIGAHMMWL